MIDTDKCMEHAEDIATLHEQNKTLFRRIELVEKDQKALNSLAVSMEYMGKAQKELCEKFDILTEEVKTLTVQPYKTKSKKWDKFLWAIFILVATLLMTRLVFDLIGN